MLSNEIFESSVRSQSDLAGVFEYTNNTGYFYLYKIQNPEGHKIIDTLLIIDGKPDFKQTDVQIKWNRTEVKVGLFIKKKLYAFFDINTQKKYVGSCRKKNKFDASAQNIDNYLFDE